MNKNLLDYIKELSKADKKTLEQKSLKLQEEVGELAKAVLPYTNAFATKRLFTTREQILEESVDSLLCALSIAYDLQYSDEEIEQMIKEKCEKWARLQHDEGNIKEKIPFEVHITVSEVSDVEKFKGCCESLNVKPIVLDLHNKAGETFKDMQTSSKFLGTNALAYEETIRIKKGLEDFGYHVVRQKIETVPWHPAAPSDKNKQEMPKDCYFECHFGVHILTPGQKEYLSEIANKDASLHVSRNAFKVDKNEQVVMLTKRNYNGTYENFRKELEEVHKILIEDFAVDKPIVEFSIFDTKISHDDRWIKGQI